MATRVASPSLRGRFKWMLACAAALGFISWLTILIANSPDRAPAKQVADADPIVELKDPADAVPVKLEEPARREEFLAAKNQAAAASFRAPETAAKPAGNFTSRYGYKIEFAGTDWTRWDDLAQVVPEAEFGALFQNAGRFLVVPVPLGDLDPRPEALDHALLARLGIAYPSDTVANFEPFEIPGAAGHKFQVRREVNGRTVDYRILTLRRSHDAFLVGAWLDHSAAKDAISDLTILDDALGRLSLDPDSNSFNRLSINSKADSFVINTFSPAHRQALGNIYNDLGLSAYNARDFAAAIESFRQAFQLQPNDPAILTNLINSHVEVKQFREALADLEPNLNRFANQPDLFAAHAFLLSELGETDAAIRVYRTLFSGGYFAEPPFNQYVTLLAGNGRVDEALAVTEQLLRSRESFAVRRVEASLLRQKGEHERAATVLQQLAANRPFSAELAYDLADCLWACNRFDEALEVCGQLLAHRYDTAHTYLLQAKSQYGLQWYAEAKKSLAAALKREPANKAAQELLALVSSTLGEGNNSAIQESIDPVPAAETLSSESTAKVAADSAHDSAYYENRSLAVSFVPSKEFKQTDRRTIRIPDAAGVVRFSTIQVSFDPISEQLFVNNLQVLDANGNTLAVGKPSDYYVIDGNRTDVATQTKILNIPVPGLQANSKIELVVTRRAIVPPSEFPYLTHYFSNPAPVRAASLLVRTDPALVKFENSKDVIFERTTDGLLWSVENPAVQRTEVLQAPRSSYLPHVTIASPNLTWKQLTSGYLTTIADRLAVDESIDTLAKQYTADATDDDAKTAAIIREVQNRLTYKAIEFGRRARVPNRAAETAQNKYGDCKDHALLLVQLLRACNIPAELALANLDEPVDPNFAAFDQFNHMLVFLPSFRGGRVIDCTDKDSDLPSLTVPTDLAGAQIFVMDANEPRFVQLPDYPKDSSRIEVARTVRVSGETDAAVEERVTVTGYHAAFLRNMFKGVPVPERAALLQRELSPLGGGMQVQSLEIDQLANRDQPLVFTASYLVRGRFRSADSVLLGELPALWERMYLDATPLATRRTPFEIEYPLDFSSTIKFAAPEGFNVQPPEKPTQSGDSKFATWKLNEETSNDGLRIQYDLHLPAGQYPASDYSAYDEAMEKAVAGLSQNVVLKRDK